jgi:hypothetical protein
LYDASAGGEAKARRRRHLSAPRIEAVLETPSATPCQLRLRPVDRRARQIARMEFAEDLQRSAIEDRDLRPVRGDQALARIA